MKTFLKAIFVGTIICSIISTRVLSKSSKNEVEDKNKVASQHRQIGNHRMKFGKHTDHPDAQWFENAGLGLFLHWGISSVKAMNISHPMIPGRPLEKKRITDPKEIKRIIREQDYNLNGKKPVITPREYFKMAESFNPNDYHPEKWLKKVKEAGFTYVVLTTKHHEGFALWPSKYNDFNTKKYMGGRDLIKEFVDACHKLDLKVGLYFSGADWHFDLGYMSYLRKGARKLNPELPKLDLDLLPRTKEHSKEEIAKHHEAFLKMVNGQVTELLSNYGKIDVIWFDGKPNIPGALRKKLITKEQIRKLQPGIVINPRMHGSADYVTFERRLPKKIYLPKGQWAEFCNPWNGIWPYYKRPYKKLNVILNDLVRCRAHGINYLLGFGPMSNGNLAPETYENMLKLKAWMDKNKEAIYTVKPLPDKETASTLASANGNLRYLYMSPSDKDTEVQMKGITKPVKVTIMTNGKTVPFVWKDNVMTCTVPAAYRSTKYDVLRVELSK